MVEEKSKSSFEMKKVDASGSTVKRLNSQSSYHTNINANSPRNTREPGIHIGNLESLHESGDVQNNGDLIQDGMMKRKSLKKRRSQSK